jgi:tetratricopeptide (TPR) repeat protein
MGAVYNRGHDSSRALEVLNRAMDMAKSVRANDLEAGILNAIGLAFANLGDRSKALESYNSALLKYQEIGNSQGDADVLRNIATLPRDRKK